MTHIAPIETRSAPLETRNEDDAPDLTAATQAVEELRTAVETFQTDTSERVTTELRGLTERLDGIETRLNRPGSTRDNQDDAADIQTRAFTGFIRHGRESLEAEEVRNLRVADDTAGGYLAPDEFTAELIKNLVEISPVRQAARIGSTASGAVILPRRTGTMTAQWVGETETRPKTQPAYGQLEIPVHEMAAYVDVSNRLLEDSAINIASELSMDFAEEFGRLEGVAFVNGDGFKKPVGLMTETTVPEVLNGHATVLQADALIRLMYDLPQFYRGNGAWMLNSSTIAAVRLLKDTSGRYLWQESLAEGQPPTLLGRPVVEAPDMPDIAANSTPIAYGDFQRGYRIYDRVGMSILRDPYSVQTEGLVRFHGRRRVGAGVTLAEAIRKLKIAA